VRLPLAPHPGSVAEWWNANVSFAPGYIAQKLRAAGHAFAAAEKPVGAWGENERAEGEYDWTALNAMVAMLSERHMGFLLELPTLTPRKTQAQIDAEPQEFTRRGWYVWPTYAHALPEHLATDRDANLLRMNGAGELEPQGGVQLFNPEVAARYGAYLKAMAAHLRAGNLYDAIVAVHIEKADWNGLPDDVDYSPYTLQRWRLFLSRRWRDIEDLNAATGSEHESFDQVPLPVKVFPPVVKIDYLHFRREWMDEYLSIKRALIAEAFPDKHMIVERWQMGDHDGIAGVPEAIWGGLYAEDHGQHTGTGPGNENQGFMIRTLGPVGFGTRLSDGIESLYRDYLWFNYTDPGNLARYFYAWVVHGYMDYQLGWQAIANHWLSNRIVNDLATTVANTAPAPQRLGLVMPRATHDLAFGPIYYAYMGWDWLLHAAKLPYTRIDERFIADGGLQTLNLEVLILPAAPAMDVAVADALRGWVADGGTLIASTMPAERDIYGRAYERPLLADMFGATVDGITSEAIAGTPLTVTIPRGIFSGGRAETTDRVAEFQVLNPLDATVVARYESGKPAVTQRTHGEGRAILSGYPFGMEGLIADRTSISFQRTYTWFVREPQVVERAAFLRRVLVDALGYHADYAVDYAEVGRYGGKEDRAMGLSVPKGFSDDPEDYLFMRTFGDPRPEHELGVQREEHDIAIRFFPRHREGVDTTFVGISTREVHYISPRATANILLSRREYHCRINNPDIQAIWDVVLDTPVGFERDEHGVSFTVTLPSGYIMMLAVSESPTVQLFEKQGFAGRSNEEVVSRTILLANGEQPPDAALLNPQEYREWIEALPDDEPVLISYGHAPNKPAAELLASFLRESFGKDAQPIAQSSTVDNWPDVRVSHLDDPWILIGNDWTNNDMALHGAYWNWNAKYGPHLPFTATYAWPGEGRAVAGLSRRYTLNNAAQGNRPVGDPFRQGRRTLFIAGDGEDALNAVKAIIEAIWRKTEAGTIPVKVRKTCERFATHGMPCYI